MINLAAPVGGFVLENTTEPQLFLGSGIGVTPLVAMYEAAFCQRFRYTDGSSC